MAKDFHQRVYVLLYSGAESNREEFLPSVENIGCIRFMNLRNETPFMNTDFLRFMV